MTFSKSLVVKEKIQCAFTLFTLSLSGILVSSVFREVKRDHGSTSDPLSQKLRFFCSPGCRHPFTGQFGSDSGYSLIIGCIPNLGVFYDEEDSGIGKEVGEIFSR